MAFPTVGQLVISLGFTRTRLLPLYATCPIVEEGVALGYLLGTETALVVARSGNGALVIAGDRVGWTWLGRLEGLD